MPSIPKQPGSSPQMPKSLLYSGSGKYQVLHGKYSHQSPVTTDELTGVYEYFKFIKEKVSLWVKSV